MSCEQTSGGAPDSNDPSDVSDIVDNIRGITRGPEIGLRASGNGDIADGINALMNGQSGAQVNVGATGALQFGAESGSSVWGALQTPGLGAGITGIFSIDDFADAAGFGSDGDGDGDGGDGGGDAARTSRYSRTWPAEPLPWLQWKMLSAITFHPASSGSFLVGS